MLPLLEKARSEGHRTLNDLFAAIAPDWLLSHPGRKLTRSRLYYDILRLKELGLDRGLDDRSTARKLGRPTRRRKHSASDARNDDPRPDIG